MAELGFIERYAEANASRKVRFSAPGSNMLTTEDLTAYSRNMWLLAVRDRMKTILDMEHGWDGYGAGKIPSATAVFTVQVLQDLWRTNLKAPDISPMSNGAIMIEWINADRELTLEIERPYVMSLTYEEGDEEVFQGEVQSDVSTISRHIEDFLRAPTEAAAA